MAHGVVTVVSTICRHLIQSDTGLPFECGDVITVCERFLSLFWHCWFGKNLFQNKWRKEENQ